MLRFVDYPIKAKLALMIAATTLGALSVALAVFFISDSSSIRGSMVNHVTILAQTVATNSSSAVSFDDAATANEQLAALGSDTHIRAATILLKDGKQFATYNPGNMTSPGQAQVPSNSHQFTDRELIVTRDIIAENKVVAAVVIRSDLTALDERFWWYMRMSGITLAATILLSWLIVWFGNKVIVRPLVNLTEAANAISVGDIQQNIVFQSRDEIGRLCESFRSLMAYLRDLAGVAQRVAANDLTATITPKSEQDYLSRAFKQMVENLLVIIIQLREHSRNMVSAASEISASSEQMSSGAREQANRIAEISSAIEEFTAAIQESANNAGTATAVSQDASRNASDGGQLVTDTIREMVRTETEVRSSAETIAKLAKSSEEIGEIIGVISDIADQTNLLALNAAIEAARAGESGRGFAVVADEVRKLADRTASATKEIAQMVKAIQKETETAVHSMNSGIEQVHRGRELADKAGTSLSEILAGNQRVAEIIQHIALAAEQQSSAATDVARNVEQISIVTRETASGAEQSAKAAEQLNKQAETLQTMVSQFRVDA